MADFLYTLGNEVRAIVMDATETESHEKTNTVTEHVIDAGANITDHVRSDRDRLTLECHVSNHPIQSPNADGASGEVLPIQLTGYRRAQTRGATRDSAAEYETSQPAFTANLLQFGAEFDRCQSVYDTLVKIKREAIPLTIVTRFEQYDQMIIADLTVPVGVTDGVKFTLELVAILFATSETVATPTPLETRAEHERARGSQGTTTPATVEQESLAAQALEHFTGLNLIHQPVANGHQIFNPT